MLDTPLIEKEEIQPFTDTGFHSIWSLSDVLGVLSPLLYLCLLIFGLQLEVSDRPESRADSELFSFWLQILAFGWWYVFNVYVWRVNGPPVGYAEVLQYERDPEPKTPLELMKIMGSCTAILFVAMLTYICIGRQGSIAINLVVWTIALCVLFAPQGARVPLYHWRTDLVKNIRQCLQSSMYCVDVRFQLTWITDMWTSACLTLWQMEYTTCSFAVTIAGYAKSSNDDQLGSWSLRASEECGSNSWNAQIMRPTMYLLPFVLRFFQECRTKNWWNVGKYFSAIMMVLSSTLHDQQRNLGKGSEDDDNVGAYTLTFWYGFWIFWAIVKTVYCYGWDILRDWGLMQDDQYLRKRRLYGRKWVYYLAIFTNLCGRISWTLALSPHVLGDSKWELMFALIEISRRGQWSFFRVEYQVINVNAAKLLISDDDDSGELEKNLLIDDSFDYDDSGDEMQSDG